MKIIEIVDRVIDNRGKTPPYDPNGNYLMVETYQVSRDRLYPKLNTESQKKINNDTYSNWFRAGHPIVGDILFTTVGEGVPQFCLSPIETKISIAQNLIALRVKKNQIIPEYLFLRFNHPVFIQEVKNRLLTTAQPSLKVPHLLDMEICIHNIIEQKKIVDILIPLYNKIELNQKINFILEQLAQTIFKSWFVDFDPVHAKKNALEAGLTKDQAERAAMAVISGLCTPTEYAKNISEIEKKLKERLATIGKDKAEELKATALLFSSDFENSDLGEIPLRSKVVPIYDLISVTGGGTPKRSEPSYWNGDIPWFSIRDIKEDGITIIETVEKITDLGLKKSSTNLLPIGTTIITARGTVGKLALIRIPMAMNQSCYGIYPVKDLGPIFNYFNLNEVIHILKRNSHGAVFDTINHSTFQTCKVVFCGTELAQAYEKIATPLIDKMEINQREMSSLTQLRDTLLPKLLAGEIDLSGVLID